MKLTLDKRNRLVVPKAVRDRFGLSPGKELEVLVEADGIRLRPVGVTPVLAEVNGLLVCLSEISIGAWALAAFIEREREGRSSQLAGV
jgi:AbrB family looped-hinge helix DNA binding protein